MCLASFPYPSIIGVERSNTVKTFFGLALLLLFFALPAHAQQRAGSNGITPTGGGGGGLGGSLEGGFGGSSTGKIPVTQFSVVTAHGDANFILSSFMPYDRAVEVGKAALANSPQSLGDVARAYHEEKARKQELRACPQS
jgi:hypothetical protein